MWDKVDSVVLDMSHFPYRIELKDDKGVNIETVLPKFGSEIDVLMQLNNKMMKEKLKRRIDGNRDSK